MARRTSYATLAVVLLSQSAAGHSLPLNNRVAASPPRASVLRMQEQQGASPEPLSTECIHVFDVNLPDGKQCQLALTRVSDDRRAKLAFWRMLYEHEAGGEVEEKAKRLARAEAELRATMALSEGETSMTFGAYLNASACNEGDEHGIALVRIEDKAMIVDALLISPKLPKEVRPSLRDVCVKSLQAIGKAEDMSVRLLTDFDI